MHPQLLVIDDSPECRAVLSRPFGRRGMHVVEAADGAAALRLMETTRFDAALLDVSMPGLSGFDVLRQIRAKHSQASLPVIMVTARTDTDDIMVAFRLGASDYVTKPIDLPVLIARVLAQVSRKFEEDRLEQALSELVRSNLELRQESALREQSEARAWDLAHHDPLTGAANRLRFRGQLTSAVKALDPGGDSSLAVLCLDLDGFKGVNDTLGHSVGDELLRAVADRIRGCLNDGDSFARLGGDEFAVVMPSPRSSDEPRRLAERLIEVISMPVMLDQHEVKVGCSVGIAFACRPNTKPSVVLHEADTALYAAKSAGRGTWRCYRQGSSD